MAKTPEEINHSLYLNLFYSSTAFARDLVKETIETRPDITAHELLDILEAKAAEAWQAVVESDKKEKR